MKLHPMAMSYVRILHYICYLCLYSFTDANLLPFSFFNIIEGCCRLWSELEQRIATLEFDRDRKSMGVMVDSSSGNKLLLVKVCLSSLIIS